MANNNKATQKSDKGNKKKVESRALQVDRLEQEMDSYNEANPIGNLKWLNLIAYAVNVAITYGIGVTGLFDLPTNGELSEKYQTLVTPIGYAFAIWGIIFLAQAIWVIQQFLPVSRFLSRETIEAIITVKCNYLLVVIAQSAWTLTFSNEIIYGSFIAMVLILFNLFMIVWSLYKLNVNITIKNYFNTVFPFTIHFGWILAATIVNANVVLVSDEYNTTIQYYSAIGGLVFLIISSIILIFWYNALLPPAVLSWALFGVYMELRNPKEIIVTNFSNQEIDTIQYAAIGASGFILLLIIVKIIFNYRRQPAVSTAEENVYLRAPDGAGRL